MSILTFLLLFMLFKKRQVALIIAFIIATICTFSFITPMCLEYAPIFFLMLIFSIISLFLEKKGNQSLYKMFFIAGILTAFFDFLTNELVVVTVPLLIILTIRKNEKRIDGFRKTLLFVFISLLLFTFGYAATFVAKWLLASVVLHINAFALSIKNMLFRINGASGINEWCIQTCNALTLNSYMLLPLYLLRKYIFVKNMDIVFGITVLLFILFVCIFFRKKDNSKYIYIILLLALLPYARYILLSGHSEYHFFFTHRAQFVTVMVVILIITEVIKEIKNKIYDKRIVKK